MKEIKFGAKGLRGSTPKQIKHIYRSLMLISALWVATIQPNFHFSDHVVAEINKWITVGTCAFYTICQCFGWSKVEDKTE